MIWLSGYFLQLLVKQFEDKRKKAGFDSTRLGKKPNICNFTADFLQNPETVYPSNYSTGKGFQVSDLLINIYI